MNDKPSMVTDVTIINCINIGIEHNMLIGSVTINTRAERSTLLNKNKRTRVDTQVIGTKKNTFQLELKKQVHSSRITCDIDSLNENMNEMIQQSVTGLAK